MAEPDQSLRKVSPPRELRADERAMIDQMLAPAFPGRDEIRIQMELARVSAFGTGDIRTLVFTFDAETVPRANTISRIPVEGQISDADGVPIVLLLHVLDGLTRELEIYRADGHPIHEPPGDGIQVVVAQGT